MRYQQAFQRKTYGRIFVRDAEDIPKVIALIHELDPSEAGYMPKDLVTFWDRENKNKPIYLHKFEMDKLALTRACLNLDIWIVCVDGLGEFDTL